MAYETTEVTPARIYLQPVAAPSILGLFGFAGATFMVSAHMVGWYGRGGSELFLVPFVILFGGLAQFLACIWAFKARDGLASAFHGLWSAIWTGFGILAVMFARVPGGVPMTGFPELGYWFIVAAAITYICAWGALAENFAMFSTFIILAAGSTLLAISSLTSGMSAGVYIVGSYLLLISSFLAFYTASALMLAECYGHSVLGLGMRKRGAQAPVVSLGAGEPGVIRGQNLNLAPEPSVTR